MDKKNTHALSLLRESEQMSPLDVRQSVARPENGYFTHQIGRFMALRPDNFWLVCAYGVGVTIEQFIEIAQADAQQSKMENNQTTHTHTQSNISAV